MKKENKIKIIGYVFIIAGLILFPLGSIHVFFFINPPLDELQNYGWESGFSVGIGILFMMIGIVNVLDDDKQSRDTQIPEANK